MRFLVTCFFSYFNDYGVDPLLIIFVQNIHDAATNDSFSPVESNIWSKIVFVRFLSNVGSGVKGAGTQFTKTYSL